MNRATKYWFVSATVAALLGLAGVSVATAQVLPPDTTSDCRGLVPVIVASDSDAQSDIYSAWTLARALNTTCVVLAGPRGGPMPQDQRDRLNAAQSTGWVVGGEAAVPTWKLPAGWSGTRLNGRNRWQTAQMVGDVASGKQAGVHVSTSDPARGGSQGIARQQVSDSVLEYLFAKTEAADDERQAAQSAYEREGCEEYSDVKHQLRCVTLLVEVSRATSAAQLALAEVSDAVGCYELGAVWRSSAAMSQRAAEVMDAALDAGDNFDDPRWQQLIEHDFNFDGAELARLQVECVGSDGAGTL